jgi:GT2 family glycosyltransferase
MLALPDPEYPLVSIIVLNLNGGEMIRNCLFSVFRTKYPKFEVIVVDNGSTDNSIEVIRSMVKKTPIVMKIIKNQNNLGFAEGNNVGVRNSNGKYIALLNNDTVVDPNWLYDMIALLEKDKNIAAVQSLLLTRDGSRISSLGGTIDILGTAEERIKLISNATAKIKQGTEEIFSACAASMVVRKSTFKEVGEFDPKFFAYFEDVDLCWRIRLRGYKVVLDPNSIVYHIGGATSKKFGKRVFDFHLYKNQIAMLIKNYHAKNLLKVMPVVILLYVFRVINGLIKNDADLAIAPLRALYWNVKELKYLLQQRWFVQRKVRRVSDDYITKMMIKLPMQIVLHFRKVSLNERSTFD